MPAFPLLTDLQNTESLPQTANAFVEYYDEHMDWRMLGMCGSIVVLFPGSLTCPTLRLVRTTSYQLTSEFSWHDCVSREGWEEWRCQETRSLCHGSHLISQKWWETTEETWAWDEGEGSRDEPGTDFAEVWMRGWKCGFRPAMAAGRRRSWQSG